MEHSELTLKLANFCKNTCPVCTRARKKGKGFLYTFVKIESKICPMCRAYTRVYNKPPYQP